MKMGCIYSVINVTNFKIDTHENNNLIVKYYRNDRDEYSLLSESTYIGQLRYFDENNCYFIHRNIKYLIEIKILTQNTNIVWLIDYKENSIVLHYKPLCKLCNCVKLTNDPHFIERKYLYKRYKILSHIPGDWDICFSRDGDYKIYEERYHSDKRGYHKLAHGILTNCPDFTDHHRQKDINTTLYIYSTKSHRVKKIGTGKIKLCRNMYVLTLENGETFMALRDQSSQKEFLKKVYGVTHYEYEEHFDEKANTEYHLPFEK